MAIPIFSDYKDNRLCITLNITRMTRKKKTKHKKKKVLDKPRAELLSEKL